MFFAGAGVSSKFILKWIPSRPIIFSEAIIVQKGDYQAMEGLHSCTSPCRGATNAAPIQFQGETARLSLLSIREDQSADVDIFTAEGDRVTLSSDYHSEAPRLTYQYLAYGNSGVEAEQGQLLGYTEERNIAMTVEGRLNDQEMADIQALLSELGAMLKAFLTGQGEGEAGVEEPSADLSRYSSLSAFNADFEYSASLQVLNLEADQLAFAATGAPLPPPAAGAAPLAMPSPQAVVPAAAAAASAPQPVAPPAVTVSAETPKPVAAQDEHLLGQIAKKVKESGLRPRRFMKLLKKFMRGLMQELRENNAMDGEKAKRGENILEKFFRQMEPPTGTSEAQASRVSLQQHWMSLQYEMKAEVKAPPRLEETA